MDAVVTELNEEAEEIKKMENIRGRKETRGSKYQIGPMYSVSTWLHFYSPKQGRSCQSPTTETWSSSSRYPFLLSFPPKTLNNKVIEVIKSSAIN